MRIWGALLCGMAFLAVPVPVKAAEIGAYMLVVDLTGKGFKAPAQRVYWDVNNDGYAEECTWPGPGEGIVAYDRNGDGIIRDAYEVVGSLYGDAFAALQPFDSNRDGVVDATDTRALDQLLVWTDANGDGRGEGKELQSFAQRRMNVIKSRPDTARAADRAAGIESISMYRHDNGRRVFWHGIGSRRIVCDDSKRRPVAAAPLDKAALGRMPDLPGMGRVPSLRRAIEEDRSNTNSLLAQIQVLAAMPADSILGGARDMEAIVESIMLRWARVDMINPQQNGPYIDARRVAFLAAAQGKAYDPAARYDFWGAYAIESAFARYYDAVATPLLLQAGALNLFSGPPSFDPATGHVSGVTGLSPHAVRGLRDRIGAVRALPARQSAWRTVARLVDYVIGYENLSMADGTLLDEAVRVDQSVGKGFMDIIYDATALRPDEIPASRWDAGTVRADRLRDEGVHALYNTMRTYSPEAPEIYVNATVTAMMRACCARPESAPITLHNMGFTSADITATALMPGRPEAALDYVRVIYGERSFGKDRFGITLYYDAHDKLQWAMGRIWHAAPAAKAPTPR